MYILGISAFYHDSAACLVRDGVIVAAAQEERFTRKKHDASFPHHAIQYCLQIHGITARDLDFIAFYEKPFLKFERILQTYLQFAPRGLRSFLTAMPVWVKQKLWLREYLKQELEFSGTVIFPEHHESHAASAFFPSPFAAAAILTIDGVGEWATASFGVGQDNRVTLLAKLQFPHSLGLLYSAFTYYLGFTVNSGEYKVMGLAPYGTPRYREVIERELMNVKSDGSLRLNLLYFNYCVGLTMTTQRFHRLFGGPPRAPESPLTQRHMDIAASIQDACEAVMLKMARHVHKVTGEENLCLAGGVALNCVGNGRILREGPFRDLWIQPAAGDAGGALGAALLVWHAYAGNPRSADGTHDCQQGSQLGPAFAHDQIAAWLRQRRYPFMELAEDELPRRVADLIADQQVVGWLQGRMEFGPRALGSRSILGDARSPEMQTVMNVKIKFRESFRPFAPAVVAERAGDYFELDRASPYMLLVAPVVATRRNPVSPRDAARTGLDQLKLVRSTIPAVTHVDYSARVQTVGADANPRFRRLLAAMGERHGCPVVINTSFNVRGEPIVCTPEDAYRCFMRTNMDYLVLERCLLRKDQQPPSADTLPWQREFTLD